MRAIATFGLLAMTMAMTMTIATAMTACGSDEDHCAVRQENCSSSYLKSKGLTGCCSGLTCQDSPTTPGARVCR